VPVVDCAYGRQKENQTEAGEVENNCREEPETGQEDG
jgi:hypothetical protein